MNIFNANRLTSVAATLAFGLLCLGQSALAQDNCKEAKGTEVDVFIVGAGNTASGTVSNAGWLNGTTLTVFPGGGNTTAWPNTFTYTGQYTLTTGQGQLKTNNLYLHDVAAGKGTILMYIDPVGSTGVFAGATGTLFLNVSKVTATGNTQTFHSELTGQICFARQ